MLLYLHWCSILNHTLVLYFVLKFVFANLYSVDCLQLCFISWGKVKVISCLVNTIDLRFSCVSIPLVTFFCTTSKGFVGVEFLSYQIGIGMASLHLIKSVKVKGALWMPSKSFHIMKSRHHNFWIEIHY